MVRLLVSSIVLVICAIAGLAQSPPSPSSTTSVESAECTQAKTTVARLESKLKDWPDIARYKKDNGNIAPPTGKERRVVFLGDSITDGWDNPANGGFFPGKPYIDRGISGQTTPQMLVRFRPDVIALNPEVVVILAGTNDIAGNTGPMTLSEIEDNLSSMAELARAHSIRVVLSSLLPVSDYTKSADGQPRIQTTRRPPEQIRALNDWMKKFALEKRLVYLDYYSAMVDDKGFLREELSNDGLHPNVKGYAVMAPLAEQAISAALKKR
jgi:lysophospholipase L1-like esterase